MTRKLHHAAYRWRNSEETRRFYEDFPGLASAGVVEISQNRTGRADSRQTSPP